MNHLSRELPSTHEIIFFGDVHIGLKASSPAVFEAVKARLKKNRNAYLCLMGDMVEGRASDHEYYNVAAADMDKPLPVQQALHVRNMLEPHSGRILSALIGNHEWGLIRKHGNIYKSLIYDPLKIPYGGFSCRLSIRDKRGALQYKIFMAHGYGSLQTTADDPVRRTSNLLLSLKRKLKEKSGDCAVMVMGHCHQLLVGKPAKMLYLSGDDKLEHSYLQHGQAEPFIHPDFRWYSCSGSSLRTFAEDHETYSELAGYNPNELGFSALRVENGTIKDFERVVV